jgi:hypothetical protein
MVRRRRISATIATHEPSAVAPRCCLGSRHTVRPSTLGDGWDGWQYLSLNLGPLSEASCHLNVPCRFLNLGCPGRIFWTDRSITDGYHVLPLMWLGQVLQMFPKSRNLMPVATYASPVDAAVLDQMVAQGRRGIPQW